MKNAKEKTVGLWLITIIALAMIGLAGCEKGGVLKVINGSDESIEIIVSTDNGPISSDARDYVYASGQKKKFIFDDDEIVAVICLSLNFSKIVVMSLGNSEAVIVK
jgi:ABC-type nitrate/sulfonate/bicarbonate transport system ATPase subunit